MAAAVYLAGVLQTHKNVHQKLNQGHGKVEEHAASSPRGFSRAEDNRVLASRWGKALGSARSQKAKMKAARAR